MRVATYTQPSQATRGSVLAIAILVLTVALGTSALPTVVEYLAPQLGRYFTYVWLLTYLVAFAGLMFVHGINWISWMTRYRILLLILLIGTMASVFWSVDATVSAERTVHLIGSSIIAIYLGFMVPLLTTLRVFAVVLGIIMLASVGSAVGLADLGIESYEGSNVWRGVLNTKNDLGFWAAAGVLLYITLMDSFNSLFNRFLCFTLALVCAGVLVMSHSATSLLALLVAGSLSLYIFIAIRFRLGFVRMVVLAVLMIAVMGFVVSNIDTTQVVGRTDDLTGRGEVWRQTWKLIMAKPLTGYGYGSLWFPNDATLWIQQSLTDFTWVVFHAHNGFLQIASEIGLPLSCIALLMVAQQLIEIFYCQYERQQVGVLFVLSFVVLFLIGNFSEARFLVNRELYWIFFLALPISMLRQINVMSDDPLSDADPGGNGPEFVQPMPVPGKPWLHIPVPAGSAAAGGAALSAASSVAASGQGIPALPARITEASVLDLDDDYLDASVLEELSQTGLHSSADIDLGPSEYEDLHSQAREAAAQPAEDAMDDPERSAPAGVAETLEQDLVDVGDSTLDLTRDVSEEGWFSADGTGDALRALREEVMEDDPQRELFDTEPDEPRDAMVDGDTQVSSEHDRFDDFEVDGERASEDRYDKSFGDPGEWIDIPLGDKPNRS